MHIVHCTWHCCSAASIHFTPTLILNLPAEIGGFASDLEAPCQLVQLLDDIVGFPCDKYEEYMNCLLKLADSVGDKDLADDISVRRIAVGM